MASFIKINGKAIEKLSSENWKYIAQMAGLTLRKNLAKNRNSFVISFAQVIWRKFTNAEKLLARPAAAICRFFRLIAAIISHCPNLLRLTSQLFYGVLCHNYSGYDECFKSTQSCSQNGFLFLKLGSLNGDFGPLFFHRDMTTFWQNSFLFEPNCSVI